MKRVPLGKRRRGPARPIVYTCTAVATQAQTSAKKVVLVNRTLPSRWVDYGNGRYIVKNLGKFHWLRVSGSVMLDMCLSGYARTTLACTVARGDSLVPGSDRHRNTESHISAP